jgi:hypothetical protein
MGNDTDGIPIRLPLQTILIFFAVIAVSVYLDLFTHKKKH